MDFKSLCMGLFLLKEFSPVMGVVVLASLLWWGVDPGLLWHSEMAPLESVARGWLGLEGGWAQFGRWGLGLGMALLGALLLVPLGLIGFAGLVLLFMVVSYSVMLGIGAVIVPPVAIFVLWMYLYDAVSRYLLKGEGLKDADDLTSQNWIILLSLTALTYGITAYWLVVRFVP